MTLSRFRYCALSFALGATFLLTSPAGAEVNDGQAIIEALIAADKDGSHNSEIDEFRPQSGVCLNLATTELAKMPTFSFATRHAPKALDIALRPTPDYKADLVRIANGEGHALTIDRAQFKMAPSGPDCRSSQYISMPVQIGSRAYVEMGHGGCGTLCGGGTIHVLRREDTGWVVEGYAFHFAT